MGSKRRMVSGAAACAVAVGLAGAPPAAARSHGGGGSAGPAGYDISFPQCGGRFPANVAFGIVGVNGGRVFVANPCLGTNDGPSELAWAQGAANATPAFYANTGDPGPAYSSHWPTAPGSPQACAGDNSPACSYDYGWNAAKDSFTNAVTAEAQVNRSTASAAAVAAAAAPWWLDVETGNSWETTEAQYGPTVSSKQNDSQAIQGAIAALKDAGVVTVGVYSTGYQWGQITGGLSLVSTPSWVAGSSSLNSAQSLCGTTGFTGGPVKLAQYPLGGYDGDVACP